MRKTRLTFIPGPAGWVMAELQEEGGFLLSRSWVQFMRKDEAWRPIALFLHEPTPESVRDVPMHRIEVAVNASAAVSAGLESQLKQSVPRPGSPEFVNLFMGYRRPDPEPLAPLPALKRPTGRRLDDAGYGTVAEFYREASARGLKPRAAIAEAAGASPDVAGRWIYEARKRGFLPPTRPGRVTA